MKIIYGMVRPDEGTDLHQRSAGHLPDSQGGH